MRIPWKIVSEGEVWRLFTPLYLTHGFLTIVANTVAQLILGFKLEGVMGTWRMAAYYFTLGICVNIFGASLTSWHAVGPEPVIFGMLSGLIAAYIFYWDHVQFGCCNKLLVLIALMLLMGASIFIQNAIAAPFKKYHKAVYIDFPDSYGSLGGGLLGFFLCWVFLPPAASDMTRVRRSLSEKTLFCMGLIVSLVITCLCTASLFSDEPLNFYDGGEVLKSAPKP